MVDTNRIAIADVLKHHEHGLVSHQPILNEKICDIIRVMDMKGNFYKVEASECIRPTTEEYHLYWRKLNRKKPKQHRRRKIMIKGIQEMNELEELEEEILEEGEPVSNLPTEPGYYWAKEKDLEFGNFHIIIRIFGTSPYLRYEGWNMTTNKTISGNIPLFDFGPKIEFPQLAKPEGD